MIVFRIGYLLKLDVFHVKLIFKFDLFITYLLFTKTYRKINFLLYSYFCINHENGILYIIRAKQTFVYNYFVRRNRWYTSYII